MTKQRMSQDTGGWRSPPGGWDRRNSSKYMRLCVDLEPGARIAYELLTPTFARLNSLLGDHEVSVTVPRLTPEAWNTELPWKQSTHSASLKTPLAALAQQSLWDLILACDAWRGVRVEASRGGGAARHLVWSIGEERSSYKYSGLNLHLAARHVNSTASMHNEVRDLAVQFFRDLCAAMPVVGGFGEVILSGEVSRSGLSRDFVGSDRWLSNGLIHTDYEHGLSTVPGPRWITLLLGRHVDAMGGKEALRTRAFEFEQRMFPERALHSARWQKAREVLVTDAGESLLVWAAPVAEVVGAGGWGSPRPPLSLAVAWLMHELATAGLLAHARTDRLEKMTARSAEQYAAYLAEAAQTDRQPKQKASEAMTQAELRELIAARSPRCVKVKSAIELEPPGFKLRDNTVCFRIAPKIAGDGLTVYGGTVDGAQTALVGSLKPERAALYFDSRRHGFDGEQAPPAPESARPRGRLKQVVCPKCKGRHFHIYAIFEYPEDLDPADAPKLPDLFSWFWLVAKCQYCRWSDTVVDVECA